MSLHLPLSLLFRALPRTAELAALREAVLAASVADPADRWKGSADYATVDRRVLTDATLDQVFAAAESRSLEHVRTYHRAVRDALRGIARGLGRDALDELHRLGEAAASEGRWEECVSYYGVLANLTLDVGADDLAILAERRLGRAHLHLGHTAQAATWYARSLDRALHAGDGIGIINAHIGRGHAYSVEGRWAEAAHEYSLALDACGDEQPRLAGQAATNLAMTAREMQRLDASREWLTRAREAWHLFENGERSVWHNNDGLLALANGDLDAAADAFETALALAPSHFDTAMILDNLSELYLRRSELDRAEQYARSAEEFAVAGASARALADIYVRLGKIARARRDPDGVAFFEKALELSREYGYVLTEAAACLEYSLFRRDFGDADEAEGLRDRADELLRRLAGTSGHLD